MKTFRDARRDRLGERRAAELLSDGFGSADMGMVLWDANLAVQLCNPAGQDLTLPLNIGDDVTAHFTELADRGMLATPAGQCISDFVHETITAIHAAPMRFMLKCEDGRHVQISTFGITSGGVMATAVDVSLQYDAQKRARALLRDAVEALEIGVLHFDSDLKLLMINQAANRMIFSDVQSPELNMALAEIIEGLIDADVIRVPEHVSRSEVIASFEKTARVYETSQRVTWQNGQTFEFSTNPTEMGGYLGLGTKPDRYGAHGSGIARSP